MQLRSINWLSIKAPEFGRLSDREKVAVADFALIWSFYEAHCLSNNANMEQIRQYVRGIPEGVIDSPEVRELVDYFQHRYTDGDQFSYRYDHLQLERSGNPEEVTRMLQGQIESDYDALIGCLGIIFRYRNNLFHGEKWAYHFHEQLENFERSVKLLLWLMEQNP